MKSFKSLVATALIVLYSSFAFAGPVNINTANAETLSAGINGVGEKRAQAIIQYREAYGAFKSVDELTQVKGIGVKLVEANRENMTVRKSNN